ncbi:glutathione S-transferase [Trametes meyenii]|nr:glutathione S-transferase [Trametes meyenii]
MASKRDVTHLTDISKGLAEADGSFKRKPSTFRQFIEKGGPFEPEKDRYHLYVAYSCPWATRTLIVRKLKGLDEIVGVTAVAPRLGQNGWAFAKIDPFPGAENDPLYDSEYIKDIYLRTDPEYAGRFTVPVLWDKKTQTIVNNESSEIIRIFNTAFNEFLPADKASLDLYPETLRREIDEVNEWVYNTVNILYVQTFCSFRSALIDGVYKTGFAITQEAYEAAIFPLFESLDRLEKILTGKEYLIGNQLTEADVRLFVTIIRFDPAYVGHFKCNIRTIRDGYPSIHLWLRKLYWNNDAFSSTCKFDHIKTSYYLHKNINPNGVVPVGPIPSILPL